MDVCDIWIVGVYYSGGGCYFVSLRSLSRSFFRWVRRLGWDVILGVYQTTANILIQKVVSMVCFMKARSCSPCRIPLMSNLTS